MPEEVEEEFTQLSRAGFTKMDSLWIVLIFFLQDVRQSVEDSQQSSVKLCKVSELICSSHVTYCSLDSGSVSMTILAECSSSSCRTASSAAFQAISSAMRAASRRSCCSLQKDKTTGFYNIRKEQKTDESE